MKWSWCAKPFSFVALDFSVAQDTKRCNASASQMTCAIY